jgi:hypothetical protein
MGKKAINKYIKKQRLGYYAVVARPAFQFLGEERLRTVRIPTF